MWNRYHSGLAPETLAVIRSVWDLLGAWGMRWLRQAGLPGGDNQVLASELELLEMGTRETCESRG